MGYTVVVSAGHSENEEGAISGGYHENILNMKLRDQLVKALNRRAIATVAVSDGLSLRETIKFIRRCVYDVAIEIHFNAGPSVASGVEAFYRTNDPVGKQLCMLMCSNLSIKLGQKNRGPKDEAQSARGRLGFVHENPRCVLIEAAFVTNPQDVGLVLRDDDGATWAETVAQTIADHLRLEQEKQYNRKPACSCGGNGCECCGE